MVNLKNNLVASNQLLSHVFAKFKALNFELADIAVGLSGGIDSVVLLHILSQLRKSTNLKLFAIHINHGLSPNANSWTDFCQQLCLELDVPLTIDYYTLAKAGGESLENIARKARYQTFFNQPLSVLALAHHQNDQVETLLSQLFRGSDLHNIAAMKEITNKNNKTIWRPLLDISRQQIEEYAKQYELDYITDESNTDTGYLRNFIRHDILPLLSNWDKNINTKLLNFNHQLQQLLTISDEGTIADLESCLASNKANIIDLAKFKQLSLARQQNVISMFIKKASLPLPSNKQVAEFIRQALISTWESRPTLKLSENSYIMKSKNHIFLR